MASSASRLGPFLLEPTYASNEELTRGRGRSRGTDLWSADHVGLSTRKGGQNGPILGLDTARWAPMLCMWVMACLEAVW